MPQQEFSRYQVVCNYILSHFMRVLVFMLRVPPTKLVLINCPLLMGCYKDRTNVLAAGQSTSLGGAQGRSCLGSLPLPLLEFSGTSILAEENEQRQV